MTPPDLPDPLSFAIPVFAVLVVAEMAWARLKPDGPVRYEARDATASLLMGLGRTIAAAVTGALGAAAMVWVHQFALYEIGWVWWAWVACFLAEDLCYYWFHRISHERRWFWASHVVHHSSQHYNLSTALRQTWTGSVSMSFVFWLPMAFIGFEPAMIAFFSGLSLIYQFWIHTEAIKRMPDWFEAVFNTPSHHRVHHATNPVYLDANYAGVLIIWDRLFETFVAEDDGEPARYGIIANLATFNPFRIAFHEWAGMIGDVARARTWRERLGFVLGPPGWSPDGSRATSASLKAAWQARQSGVGSATSRPGQG
jgi:sterol desaturase/sphingolipid hydroxylase (fatty acid hydroxylase superfamily)